MDRATVDVYERRADEWIARKHRPEPPTLRAFAGRARGVVVDLGCGPGWHSAALGEHVVAIDAARSMVARVGHYAPSAWPVQGDLEQLPLRRASLGGAWAHKCYQHLPAERLPMALAELHAALAVGAPLELRVTSDRLSPQDGGIFAGRHFTYWSAARLRDVVEGAGFDVTAVLDDGREWLDVEAVRAHALPDTVGPGMRLLLVGLNPSVYSADAGYGFARPGNRFWPAAVAAGLVTRDRDPLHAMRIDGIGMTNLVRRPTPRADALTREEYLAGAARLERLVEWLAPRVVCFVGLTGYRAAVDRKATAGAQEKTFGGRPVYVMPNPSGLNAHTKPAQFADHLRAALRS